ncbi:hypothetical protein EF847_11795 [Actinobacteria bacterium YIM 96077]|uniref:Uncharacterized protein n=1 Tax=Phytoactinopolyspora halophila TaxID=1981511 RepID=A0A329R008_9ACTN|nr:hypothetical protein [Phytoactinopolyspora halophila]AYY13278.1 hypothetical protein EF847_11795 [Actinobacteria bacterium YIM 96077]RAW17486.1 hypothetical protein DPM12_05625 [Phytoactinopolyspora halophila]
MTINALRSRSPASSWVRSAVAVAGAAVTALAMSGTAWSAPEPQAQPYQQPHAPLQPQENPQSQVYPQPQMAGLTDELGEYPDGEAGSMTGLWTGSSFVTMKRGTTDVTVGYTMRSDFWFQIDAQGQVSGHAYAVYQPTFDASGLDAKISVVKNYTSGMLGMLPGGQLGMVSGLINAAKEAGKTGIAGIVGVKGKYEDPQPVRSGEITGYVDDATNSIHIEWVDAGQASSIPLSVSLAYIDENVPVTDQELDVWTPWQEPAVISEGSQGWLAVSDTSEQSEGDSGDGDSEEDGDSGQEATSSVTQFWTAQRVGSIDG